MALHSLPFSIFHDDTQTQNQTLNINVTESLLDQMQVNLHQSNQAEIQHSPLQQPKKQAIDTSDQAHPSDILRTLRWWQQEYYLGGEDDGGSNDSVEQTDETLPSQPPSLRVMQNGERFRAWGLDWKPLDDGGLLELLPPDLSLISVREHHPILGPILKRTKNIEAFRKVADPTIKWILLDVTTCVRRRQIRKLVFGTSSTEASKVYAENLIEKNLVSFWQRFINEAKSNSDLQMRGHTLGEDTQRLESTLPDTQFSPLSDNKHMLNFEDKNAPIAGAILQEILQILYSKSLPKVGPLLDVLESELPTALLHWTGPSDYVGRLRKLASHTNHVIMPWTVVQRLDSPLQSVTNQDEFFWGRILKVKSERDIFVDILNMPGAANPHDRW
ncbi:hypothetical protein HDU97_000998 [Phlyctochytrium planicorne]|nr:hypothetical protein HDU97_000998 [Phlyctochytrium planicorne]